jgi:ribosomal protein S18 acetylase RimI-like enzyme
VALEVRTYRDSDRPAVVALWNTVFGYEGAYNDPDVSIRRKLDAQPDLLFVADLAGEVVGTIMAGYDGHRGWIYSVAVSPNHRRRGIGSALMQRAERALTELGAPKINLQVRGNNSAVVPFYQSLGFRVEERISMGKVVDDAEGQ